MVQPLHTGRCNCGAVRFELSADPQVAGYCHCTRCQRRTGAAASPSAHVDASALTVVAGAELISGWRHPDGGSEKRFCSVCGSHLFAQNPDAPDTLAVRFSAFDNPPEITFGYRQFVHDAAPWEPIPADGVHRFPGPR